MLYHCATTTLYIILLLVCPSITGVHALALVLAVACTHAFAGVSYLLLALSLLAYMILPYSVMLPASMLLQVFLLLSDRLLLASMLLSFPMLLLAPMLLQVFLLSLDCLLLALLHYECCSMMSFLLLFSRAHAGKVFRTLRVPGRRPFAFPNAGKVFRSPECDLLHSPMLENSGPWSQARSSSSGVILLWHGGMLNVSFWGPEEFSGIWECKRSPCRDPKSFLT
jgi:hypothetical protein